MLVEDAQQIDDVVVVGYGTVKKGDLTTAVSAVSTKDINERPIVSAAQAIQGKVAGVLVSSPSGKPGEKLTVRVRGATSVQAGNDPLYIIDGIPTTNTESLSADDIESMQILKDASSAAIYGARAANGVVLITTKRGKAGRARVAFNAYYGVHKIGNTIEALNIDQYKALLQEIPTSTAIPDNVTQNTNWNKEIFKTGQTQNYQLSVSNGTDKLQYFISGGYTQDVGVINQVQFRRYNFRSNVDNQIYDWLKIGANVSYSNTEDKNKGIDNKTSSRAGVILSVINTPPYMEIWNPDPTKKGQYDDRTYGNKWVHPIAAIAENNSTNINNYLLGSAFAEVRLCKGLKAKSSIAVDYKNWIGKTFLDNIATAYGRSEHGISTDSRSADMLILNENLLMYDQTLGKHTLSALAGHTFQTQKTEGSYIRGFDYLPYPNLSTLNLANQIDKWATNTSASQWSMLSFLARVSYNYDSRYLLTANFRADASSKLAPGKQWGYFPSVSAAWRISNEAFMKQQSVVNDLKIRAGWGINGNQNGLSAYAWQEKYKVTRVEPTEAVKYPGVALSRETLENRDLTWETTMQTNIGIDATILNSRLTIAVDAYIKDTKDLLLWVPLPNTTGVAGLDRNDGEMRNMGLELMIGSRNFVSDFQWSTDFNISFNKNEVKRLGLSKVYDYGFIAANETNVVRMVEGQPLGSFFGYVAEKYVDPETGKMIYVNQDGNPDITTSDRVFIGNPWPKFIFGMTNTFSYFRFDLSIFLQGSYGNDIFNASRIETEGMYDFRNQSTKVLDRWVRPGQITEMPKANDHQWNNKASTRFVEDGSYLRLKTLTLAYNFTGNWFKKVRISKLRPYITMNNLFTLTKYSGYDPEVNFEGSGIVQGVDYGTYPQNRSFIFGVNLEF